MGHVEATDSTFLPVRRESSTAVFENTAANPRPLNMGIDTLSGGAGSDIFYFAPEGVPYEEKLKMTITDFDPDGGGVLQDHLGLQGLEFEVRQDGADLRLNPNNGKGTVILLGVNEADFASDDLYIDPVP
jgi:Ca2+-binding RTX toxin-like protein